MKIRWTMLVIGSCEIHNGSRGIKLVLFGTLVRRIVVDLALCWPHQCPHVLPSSTSTKHTISTNRSPLAN